MIIAFLMGLLAVAAVAAIVTLAVIGIRWLKGYISKRLENRKNHKVGFADTRELVNEFVKNKSENAEEISMEDLEKLCEEMPFVAADIDKKTGEISDYEGIRAEHAERGLKAMMRQNNGLILVEE